MRIALVAPFDESVPPLRYGGTELVVHLLAEELHHLGHEVTLFASGDSITAARLIPGTPSAVRLLPEARNRATRAAFCYLGIGEVLKVLNNERFDIIHNHIGWPLLAFKNLIRDPLLTTLHGTLVDEHERNMYAKHKKSPFLSISDSQRKPLPTLNYVGTVHHGLDLENFDFNNSPDDYLAFLGRITPDKGPKQAIAIAKATGKRLLIGAKIDPTDEAYYSKHIKPHIDGKQIVYLGELDHAAKVQLLRNACALISPLQWDEPFGLVNIEALACGTPVIATTRGSLPEIITNGKVGFFMPQ